MCQALPGPEYYGITAAARRISASNLNRRLDLRGPDDELKALGDTLDELFGRLEASFHAQQTFVANASHELGTPLTRERAMLQVAFDDPGTTAETWRGVAADVLTSNAEPESLIEALLALASSQSGLGEREVVDLAATTNEVLRSARPEATRRRLTLEAVTRPAPMLGDKVLTERLVANLIGNALRHNVAGGRVEVSTAAADGHAVLTVANTGPNVPPQAVGQLFQPFVRLDGRRAIQNGDSGLDGGHGLGLSIVDPKVPLSTSTAAATRTSRYAGSAKATESPIRLRPSASVRTIWVTAERPRPSVRLLASRVGVAVCTFARGPTGLAGGGASARHGRTGEALLAAV
jgi:signal transduction histidine kinase